MCGIAGIFSLDIAQVSESRLLQMSDKMAHRGPDGFGTWISKNRHIGFAHRRLSIIDLDASANQPMHYLDRYTIVFNGEIYNYLELKSQLVDKGYSFRTKSDTEVLLALYDYKKEKLLEEVDGMFAFCIYDSIEDTLFCARDRFGEKPFYYWNTDSTFLFASEMKCLWAGGVEKRPDEEMVFLYLAYGTQQNYESPDGTFFKGIKQLEPATFLKIDKNKNISKRKYWDIDWKFQQNDISSVEAVNVFTDLFSSSIMRRLRSDVPVGSSLSGGLDSSSIVMLIDKLKSGSQVQKTFSARFTGFERDEGSFIDMVVAGAKVEPHQVFLTPEILQSKLKEVAYYQEEPFGSTSIVAQWEVMKLAKEHNVTVLLDGQGADEILAGYLPYFSSYYSGLYLNNRKELKNQISHFNTMYGKEYPLGVGWKFDTLFPRARTSFRKFKNVLSKPDYFAQFNSEFLSGYKKTPYRLDYNNSLNGALYFALMKGGMQNLLRYADRNSMAHSREVRLPFLDYKLVEFVFSLPDHFKLKDGWTKFVLRDSMKNILPAPICWRKEKVGFEPPRYKSAPEEYYQDSIQRLTSEKIIDPTRILPGSSWEYIQAANLFL
jgi:asparagine synthase (glutamine-hydrolysing)